MKRMKLLSIPFLLIAALVSIADDKPIPKTDTVAKAEGGFSPPDVVAVKGGVAHYQPGSEVVAAEYIGLSGEEPFPLGDLGGSKTAFFWPVRGVPDGEYKFVGVGSDKAGKLTRKDFSVVVGKPGPVPPPKPKPTPDPEPPVPGNKVSKFVVVEDTAKPGPWRGEILGSAKFVTFYKQAGLAHRLIDVNITDGENQDPAAKYFLKAAAGKPLPYLWQLDANGAIIKEGPAKIDSVDSFIADFNVKSGTRGLGYNPSKVDTRKFKVWNAGVSTPKIPRAQWKNMSLAAYLPPVYDQDGRGQCVGSSTCSLLEGCRNMTGLPPVHLSAGDLYSNINGGRDRGASLQDAMEWITSHGVATTSSVPYVWNGRRATSAAIVTERKNYMAVEVYYCPDFDSAVSALQQGFFLEEALTWYNGFMTPGPDGWLKARSGGVAGGHALLGYGVSIKADGTVGILTRNSWGTGWWHGSADGSVPGSDCVIPEQFFDVEGDGFFAVRSVVQTPTAFPFPTSKLDLKARPQYALAW